MTSSARQQLFRPALAIVGCAWLVLGCGGNAATTVPSHDTTAATGTARLATVAPVTIAPVTAQPATVAPATVPPATAQPPSVTPSTASPDMPPDALLSEGGQPVAGKLGSYCWHSACVDGPAFEQGTLPKLAVVVAPTIELAGRATYVSIDVSYIDKTGASQELSSIQRSFDPDAAGSAQPLTGGFTFPAPPKGSWVLVAHVRFADGSDAPYGWQVIVQ